jgi:CheY-like chemotaxis protein
MKRIRLIHWNQAEARVRARRIREAGFVVKDRVPTDYRELRELRENPPDAIVIDLSRLPSHGRDIGVALRHSRSTRHIPLLFVEGTREKVERTKKALPDAIYTSWGRIRSSLRDALAKPPRKISVPRSALEGYSGTPLVKKLGIKPDAVVALINAPEGFERTLGKLPPGVLLRRNPRGKRHLSLWFTTSQRELQKRIRAMVTIVGDGGLWILWPKRSSGVGSDLTQTVVRNVGLAAGLVDFKVCAVDATWSGLRFVRRKEGRNVRSGS